MTSEAYQQGVFFVGAKGRDYYKVANNDSRTVVKIIKDSKTVAEKKFDKKFWQTDAQTEKFNAFIRNHGFDTPPICEIIQKYEDYEEWQNRPAETTEGAGYFDGDGNFIPQALGDDVLNHLQIVSMNDNRQMYYYHERSGLWKPNASVLVEELATNLLGDSYSKHRVDEAIFYVRATTYRDRSIFNMPVNLIPLENGVLDINTMQISPYTSNVYFITKLPVKYTPEAKCELINKFLSEIVPEDKVMLLKQIIAYTLFRGYPIQKALMLVGIGANGKCQIKGDKVLLADGSWKNIEDIKIGDCVISPQLNGSCKTSIVIGTHNRFENNIYEVREKTRKHRLLYTCAGNHDIPIIRNYSKRTSKDDSTPRKLSRILDCWSAEKISTKTNNKSQICSFSTTAVEFEKKNSFVDPYCIGIWLGDGHYGKDKGSVGITSADKKIIEEFEKIYPNEITRASEKLDSKNTFTYNITKRGLFVSELKRLGLAHHNSDNKFIPQECLTSDIGYRKKLLAGLIDTDGFIDKAGSVSICTKSNRMANNIKNLVFSIGGYSEINKIKKFIKKRGFVGEYFNVSVQFKNFDIPLKTWKINRIKKRRIDPRHVAIECLKTHPQQVYGIEIDSPSKWYVTNNWMITHNSVYLSIVKHFLGEENVCSKSLQDLEYNRFAKGDLYQKYANIYPDLSSQGMSSSGIFKFLTGGDMVSAEHKHQDSFNFTNFAKLLFSCNQMPIVNDDTGAYYRRWIIINFPNKFSEDKADKTLTEKLTTETELSGLLNEIMPILKELTTTWQMNYGLSEEEIREQYIRLSDSVGAFFMDCCEISSDGFIPKEDLYNSYADYCRKRNTVCIDKGVFSKNLSKYAKIEEYRPEIDGRRVNCWRGIRVIDIPERTDTTEEKKEPKGLEKYAEPKAEKPEEEPVVESHENTVLKLMEEYDRLKYENKGVPEADLLEAFGEENIPEVQKILERLVQKSLIFQPRAGVWKRL